MPQEKASSCKAGVVTDYGRQFFNKHSFAGIYVLMTSWWHCSQDHGGRRAPSFTGSGKEKGEGIGSLAR